jgi:hypothetical protein
MIIIKAKDALGHGSYKKNERAVTTKSPESATKKREQLSKGVALSDVLKTSSGIKFDLKIGSDIKGVHANTVNEAVRLMESITHAPGMKTSNYHVRSSPAGAFHRGHRIEVNKTIAGIAHELAHIIEDEVPGVREATSQFLSDNPDFRFYMGDFTSKGRSRGEMGDYVRTKSNDLWKTAPDRFVTEVLTVGVQHLVQNPKKMADDYPEFTDFIISLLDGSGRKPKTETKSYPELYPPATQMGSVPFIPNTSRLMTVSVEEVETAIVDVRRESYNEGHRDGYTIGHKEGSEGSYRQAYRDALADLHKPQLLVSSPQESPATTAVEAVIDDVMAKAMPSRVRLSRGERKILRRYRKKMASRQMCKAMDDSFVWLVTGSIAVNAQELQYKETDGAEDGLNEERRSEDNEKLFDPMVVPPIACWRDWLPGQPTAEPPSGQIYVVDGHKRLGVAKKRGVPTIRGFFIEADSFEDAKRKGEELNEKMGTKAFNEADHPRDSHGEFTTKGPLATRLKESILHATTNNLSDAHVEALLVEAGKLPKADVIKLTKDVAGVGVSGKKDAIRELRAALTLHKRMIDHRW